jgi:hypothetical protein
MYPPLDRPDALEHADEFWQEAVTQSMLYTGLPRVIQSLNVTALVALAEHADGVLEMVSTVGDTLVESTPMLRVHGARETINERDLRKAIPTSTERTFEQDPSTRFTSSLISRSGLCRRQ